MDIYLIRHGETDYNLKRIVQGRGVDSELNATGVQQGKSFFDHYRHLSFDHVFISELKRTSQTVKQFIDLGIPFTKMAALDEINWGIYEGIAHNPEMHERYLSIIQKWRDGALDIRIDGGESAVDLRVRQEPFFDLLESSSFEKILVCSHGRSIRSLLCTMTGTPLSQMDDFPHMNTSLYKLKYDNGNFEVELFNDTTHLNESI